MELPMTQVMDENKVNDENEDNAKVGILRVGTTEHSITRGFTKIGRSVALCKIVIDNPTVSKVHAEIQAESETAFISDVRSVNGTKIGNVSLKPYFYYTINDGDAICLGNVKAIFETTKSAPQSTSDLTETPIPSRRLNQNNTPGLGNASDCLFNNTTLDQSDDSVIFGTQQKSEKRQTFQEPSAPVDRRRLSNRIASACEKTNKQTKSKDDVDVTDLHDLETQQFSASEVLRPNKSKRNDTAKKSQDDVESADVHELETQKMDDNAILRQRKPRSEKNEQYSDDDNIYDEETQDLPQTTKNKQPKNEEKINRTRMNDSVTSSSRGYNSSSNLSRLLRISASPSPPPSPNSLSDDGDLNHSQNLLEMCDTPLLELEKKSNGSGKSGKSSELKNLIKNSDPTSGIKSDANFNSSNTENFINHKKSNPSNDVIAESEDESATDDELDIENAKASPGNKKIGNSSKPSEVIEDDSATDDEGHFESLAAQSPPKAERKISLKIRRVSTENRTAEENIFDAETQRMDEQKFKLGGAKFRKETSNIRKAEDNIFDAETQRMDEETSINATAKKIQAIAEDTEVEAKKIDRKTMKMKPKLHDAADDIFEAATQLMDQENPAEVFAGKCRKTAQGRQIGANVFDAETQQMDLEIHKVPNAKKRRQIEEDTDDDTNIFESDTQIIHPESSRENRLNKLRELDGDCKAKENIFDAETQQMDVEISKVAKLKKRQKTDNSDIDGNIFEAPTQRTNFESLAEVPAKKRRESKENRVIETNIFDAATQQMDDDISDLVKSKKRCDIAKNLSDDTDIELLPTQVLDVPTSTPVSRSRKWKEQQSKNTPIVKEQEDIADESSTENSDVASPKLGGKNTRNKKDKQAEVSSTSSLRSPKSKRQQTKKSHRLEMKNTAETSPITKNLEDSIRNKAIKRSSDRNSSSDDEKTENNKNNEGVNLDETLMRNLGIILDQEANNQELANESMQLMTQNLVDILKPSQSFEENKSVDSEDEISDAMREISSPKKKKKEKFRSPSTLGFVDGQAVRCGDWSDDDVPKVPSSARHDEEEDEEKNGKNNKKPELPEWLDPNSIFFGLPEVRISGTLSNPGSPCSSTTSNHDDFVAPNSREPSKSAKAEEEVALSSTTNSTSLKSVESAKPQESDSPVVQKKSKIARKRIAKKIIEDEDQDSDESFAYNDLKKMADDLLASGSVNSRKLELKDKDSHAEEPEIISTTGRTLRHVKKDFSLKNDVDFCQRTRKLAKPSPSLIVSDFKGKRSAEDTTINTESESSSSGAKRTSRQLPKSAKSRSKVVTKRGKESQEVEAILSATPKKNVPAAVKRPYVKVQLTRLNDSDISKQSSARGIVETPNTNRKRRATVSAKDVTPTSSPASAKSRRTISEGLENQTSLNEQHKILLTGLTEEHTKLAKKLGGLVVAEPSKATVLITDKVRRTYKFLCAVARGLRVVSVNWLFESQKASRFLDCDDFILNDPAAEKLYQFQLEKSLELARTKKFLQGYTIIVTPKVNQPEIHELKGMVEASGGKVLTRAPGARAWNTKTVIVSREEDLTALKALLSKCPKTIKITVQSVEFILSGILRQEVNLVEHKLDIP